MGTYVFCIDLLIYPSSIKLLRCPRIRGYKKIPILTLRKQWYHRQTQKQLLIRHRTRKWNFKFNTSSRVFNIRDVLLLWSRIVHLSHLTVPKGEWTSTYSGPWRETVGQESEVGREWQQMKWGLEAGPNLRAHDKMQWGVSDLILRVVKGSWARGGHGFSLSFLSKICLATCMENRLWRSVVETRTLK